MYEETTMTNEFEVSDCSKCLHLSEHDKDFCYVMITPIKNCPEYIDTSINPKLKKLMEEGVPFSIEKIEESEK